MNSDQFFKERDQELQNRKKRGRKWLILILLLFLLLLFLQYKLKQSTPLVPPPQNATSLESDVHSLEDSLAMIDSLKKVIQQKKDSLLALDTLQSSAVKISSSSVKKEVQQESVKTDSIAPLIDVNPIAGKYEEKVTVTASCPETKCILEYRKGESWQKMTESLELSQTTTLNLRATDSAGNRSVREMTYTLVSKDARCGKNGVFIENLGGYCIDKYEWPNEYGAEPMGAVSHAKAVEWCSSVGKKLCSVDQWKTACSAQPSGRFKYSYGDHYQGYCATNGKTPERSGYRQNCRSWNGVYDMSGNNWEWTSTQDQKMKTRYLAIGGNFASKNATTCSETTFSFFPQNEYVGLGFRCCQEI